MKPTTWITATLVFILNLMMSLSAQTVSKGISFIQEHSLQTALDNAKAQNKLVFVDCYTTWCGPCKMLSTNTFPDSTLGAFFNDKFVSVKLDMEQPENRPVGTKYGVKAYPTMLFLMPEGDVAHKAIGYMAAPELLEIAKTALNPEKNLYSVSSKIASGRYTANDIKAYLLADNYAADAQPLLQKYLSLQKPEVLFTEGDLKFISRVSGYTWADSTLSFLWTNRDNYEKSAGKDKFYTIFKNALKQKVSMSRDKTQALEALSVYGPEIKQEISLKIELDQASRELMKDFKNSERWTKFFATISSTQKKLSNTEIEDCYTYVASRVVVDSTLFAETKSLILKGNYDSGEAFIQVANIVRLSNLARSKKSDPALLSEVAKNIKKYSVKPANILNDIAWNLFQYSTKPAELASAAILAEESVKQNKNENNLDTFALLMAKIGDFKTAINIEKEALAYAQKNENANMIKTTQNRIAQLEKGKIPVLSKM